MPIHDWTRVPAGLFHDCRQTWTIHIRTALNGGILPKGMSALVEQRTGSVEADVLAIESQSQRHGVHVSFVDLFPPTPRDPLGLHKLIWDEISDEAFAFPAGKDRPLASYEAGDEKAAYLDFAAVGESLPELALFVSEGLHVKAPLEATYATAWASCPEAMRVAVETGILPESG